MIELKITVSDTDYEALASAVIPSLVKNKLLSKTVLCALKAKIKCTSPRERDRVFSEFLVQHKETVIKSLTSKLEKNGICASVTDFSAKARL